jgi:hypothetical protein
MLCWSTCKVLRVHLAIKIDDRSHETEHRRRRDACVQSVLEQAKISPVRIPAARSYDVPALRQQLGIGPKLGPSTSRHRDSVT